MNSVWMFQDLFDHNDWGNSKIWELCSSLSISQLDQPRAMGFGSLRNTVFHLLEAEKIWLERWQGKAWRPLVADAGSTTIAEIAEEGRRIAEARNALIGQEASSGFSRVVRFQDSQEQEYAFPIGYLLNHVSNHGIHHRSQALSYLKQFDVKVPGGLDYLFWKLAYPSCEQPAESLQPLRDYGLAASESEGKAPIFEQRQIQDYFAYNDWAMDQIFKAAKSLPESLLDEKIDLGMGSLRGNIQHMIDAERWWLANWKEDRSSFPHGEEPRSLANMIEQLEGVRSDRNQFVCELDADSANRVVTVNAGGPDSRFRVTESLIQLCGHGTHHRAQCVNMLRQLKVDLGWIDFIIWVRQKFSSKDGKN